MNEDQRGETVINVRLKAEDREALQVTMERVREDAGPGVVVSAASAVRWALHVCAKFIVMEASEKGT